MNSAIERAVLLMRDFGAPWAIAGGWALDHFLRYESRAHADIDIAILRAHQQQLRSRLDSDNHLERASIVATLRNTRYQAAVLHHGALLLVQGAFRNGPTVWILPRGVIRLT